jgi:hypothetical protein
MTHTAVQWLVNMFEMQGTITPVDVRQAIKIEREQIIEAHIDGQVAGTGMGGPGPAEWYYQDTFKSE